jgi:hypothetical protein
MTNNFIDAVANTREEFFGLVKGAALLFYEVFDGEPSSEFEQEIGVLEVDEKYVRLNLRDHSDEARRRFCTLSEIERRAFGLKTDQKPTPYLGVFIPGLGFVDKAFTISEVERFREKARREKRLVLGLR